MRTPLSTFKSGGGTAGALVYQGTWDASTNTPLLANGTGEKGQFYKVTVAGTVNINGNNVWDLGDLIAYNGLSWDRIEGGMPFIPPPGPSLYTWYAYSNSPDGLTDFAIGTWNNHTYLGYALNKSSSVESTDPSLYTWVKIQGATGPQGTTGTTGAAGPQGNNLYTWIAYADSADGTTGFIIGVNTGQKYIGIANNQLSEIEGTNPAAYTWSLIKGTDGVPGTPGIDGQPTYTWFAYANDINGSTGFTTGAWTNQTYLGLSVNNLSATESQNPGDYSWSKMQGDQGSTGPSGAAGAQGDSMYTWIAYADNATGSINFTTGVSGGRTYIGIANNKTSSIESMVAGDYTWSLIKGDAGVPGTPGADGQTTYTWFAYANSPDGTSGFTTGAWSNQTYLGIAANKTTSVESTNPAEYSWSKIQGAQGDTGPTGAAGPQGDSMYTWVAYANSSDGTSGFTTGTNTGQTYIGIANNKTTSDEGSNPAEYVWSLIKGTDGIPGTPGIDGQPTYTWFAYANSPDGTTDFTTGAWTNQKYLGLSVNNLVQTESLDPADYSWSLMQGAQGDTGPTGAAGAQGNSLYTWIAYADNATGSTNFSIGANTGQAYIGIANNQTSSTESINPLDYVWSKITGTDGIPGTPGADGHTTYTWFAYADSADGFTNFTTGDPAGRAYLGLSVNNLTATESINPLDYFWTKIKGDDGIAGTDGTRGAGQFFATGSSWSDSVANNAVIALYPSGPIANDTVTISDGTTFTLTKIWNGVAWVAQGTVLDGNLIVTGSLSATKISSGTLLASTDLTVGTAVRSGTTMGSGSGAIISGDGTFSLGNPTNNITFDGGAALIVNGPVIGTSNLQSNSVTVVRSARNSSTGTYQTFLTSSFSTVNGSTIYFPPDANRGTSNIMLLSWWPDNALAAWNETNGWTVRPQYSYDNITWTDTGDNWFFSTPECPTGDQDVSTIWDWGTFIGTVGKYMRLTAKAYNSSTSTFASIRGFSFTFLETKR